MSAWPEPGLGKASLALPGPAALRRQQGHRGAPSLAVGAGDKGKGPWEERVLGGQMSRAEKMRPDTQRQRHSRGGYVLVLVMGGGRFLQ